MIKKIIKRNGSIEDLSPSKINMWGEWASANLGDKVDWSSVVLETVASLPEVVDSQTLQERLIKTCLDYDTWAYYRMAGRLYAAYLHKNIHGDKIPTIKDVQDRLLACGLMRKLDYSAAEYEILESVINHELDFDSAHFELHHTREKYALKNRVTGQEFETQQFVYMRMAMALGEDQPAARRIDDVKKWYKYFSEKKLNAPTPNYVNLGTPLRGYASCCVYTTLDTAASLAVGDHIAYMMTVMSAGIGNNINTRSVGDPVRGGAIKHQGRLPYYKALAGAVKANLQNGRGGAATTFYSAFDPEVDTIARLKNPMSTEDKKNRDLDYGLINTRFFARKAAKKESIFTFNSFTAPDLWQAMYGKDEKLFEELYEKYENDNSFKKNYVSAREIALLALNEANETGRHYLWQADEANKHTPFNQPVHSSNLCLTGDTQIQIQHTTGEVESMSLVSFVEQFELGGLSDVKVKSYNTETKEVSWNHVSAAAKTATVEELYEITDESGKTIKCTANHMIYTKNRGYVRAADLVETDELCVDDQ